LVATAPRRESSQRPLRPNPESRRGDGAVPRRCWPTHKCPASRRLAEAQKPNSDFAPPLLPAGEERGLGGVAEQRPQRPNPESRRGDGAVPRRRWRTHRCPASRGLAEAQKPNSDFAPPLLPAGEERGLGGVAGQRPQRPNPESRRGDGAVPRRRWRTHRHHASRSPAEAQKPNSDFS